MTDDLHCRLGLRSVTNGTAETTTYYPRHGFLLITAQRLIQLSKVRSYKTEWLT